MQIYIYAGRVDETMKQALLADVKQTHADQKAAWERARAVSQERREAIQRAMDAGVPRQEIADALGVNRVRLYDILKGR